MVDLPPDATTAAIHSITLPEYQRADIDMSAITEGIEYVHTTNYQ